MRSTGVYYESYGYHSVSFSPSSVLHTVFSLFYSRVQTWEDPVSYPIHLCRSLVGRGLVCLVGELVLPSDNRKWELLAALGWAMFIYCSPAHMGLIPGAPLGCSGCCGRSPVHICSARAASCSEHLSYP